MAGKKLLVADDSLTIQKVIRLALSNEGYEIQAVSDGNDAIQQISLFRPDAVLIDVSLPGKSAFEVKRAINEHADLEEVRFILMSSAFEKVDEPQVEEVRFHGRLTKPFDPAHLRQILSDTLEQVAAKRREPTSLLQRPAPEPDLSVAPPPIQIETTVSDDWLKPVVPDEPIVTQAPPSEEVNQLWDHEPTLALEPTLQPPPPSPSASPAFRAPPPPAPAAPVSLEKAPHGGERDADIRHLTESTIRMSGLDDFQWSVNEPSLKPPSNLTDAGGSSFQIEAAPEVPLDVPPFHPELTRPDLVRPDFIPEIANVSEAAPEPEFDALSLSNLPAPSIEVQSAASPSDFYRDPTDLPKKIARPPLPFTPPPAPPGISSMQEASVVGISSDQVEELLRKELQKLLPDLAERIIKQEIHRMLSEPTT